MTVTTERDRIRAVAERWLNQYPVDGERTLRSHRTILAKLQAMNPETATSAEVEAVIGNESWTTVRGGRRYQLSHRRHPSRRLAGGDPREAGCA